MHSYRLQLYDQRGFLTQAADVLATHPDVAVKRFLGGGHQAGYRYATVGPHRLKLALHEQATITITRV